jgi:hypothetical protein
MGEILCASIFDIIYPNFDIMCTPYHGNTLYNYVVIAETTNNIVVVVVVECASEALNYS